MGAPLDDLLFLDAGRRPLLALVLLERVDALGPRPTDGSTYVFDSVLEVMPIGRAPKKR